MRKINLVITFIICFSLFNIKAQHSVSDSLLNILNSKSVKDPARINILFKLGDLYYNADNMDSAILIYDKALKLSEQTHDHQNEIKLNNQIGVSYDCKGNYDKEAPYLFKALKMSEDLGFKKLETKILLNLGILNFNLKQKEKVIEYDLRALKNAQETNDSMSMVSIYNNLGNAYMTLFEDLKRAEPYFIKTIELGQKIGHNSAVKVGLTNLTEIYSNTKQFDKALKTCQKVLDASPHDCYALYNLGIIWYQQKVNDKALKYMKEALKYTISEPELKQVILKNIADIHRERGEYNDALAFYLQYTTLKDSIHNLNTEKHIMELETKYQSEKHKKEIVILKAEKKQRNIFIYSLISLLIVSGIAIVFIYRNIQSKRIIAEQTVEISHQKILKLENERQLTATHAVLQGEETERNRLARDLHDGLGGLLSGVKIKLSHMKSNFIISEENVNQFDHAIGLLDNSISELRRVAHNLMPEALIKFGLKDVLQDFCDQIDSKEIKINFQFYGEEKRIERSIEIALYRIGQELINNSLKHAAASELLVQLIQDETRVQLTVQDNGKGFDPKGIDGTKSIGLKNIRARVESFNGSYDIVSNPGMGTEISVEFGIG
jgi:two-component system, NarL family, sensor kinase